MGNSTTNKIFDAYIDYVHDHHFAHYYMNGVETKVGLICEPTEENKRKYTQMGFTYLGQVKSNDLIIDSCDKTYIYDIEVHKCNSRCVLRMHKYEKPELIKDFDKSDKSVATELYYGVFDKKPELITELAKDFDKPNKSVATELYYGVFDKKPEPICELIPQ